MATEYSRLIFNLDSAPSPKFILVAVPLYMYRIQTSKFDSGLNFFEKTIFRFMARPDVSSQEIAESLGLDEKLVLVVQGQLQSRGLVNSLGYTEKGRLLAKNMDSIIVDPTKSQIGYIFQNVDDGELYPYYISSSELGQEPNVDKNGNLIIGTKGDGEDRILRRLDLDFVLKKQKTQPTPDEEEILDLIGNSIRRSRSDDRSENDTNWRNERLAIRPLNNAHPELVYACTYLYLPQSAEDSTVYEPDWQIMDPFGHGDSPYLKFYIEGFSDSSFKSMVEKKFGDAKTLMQKKVQEYQYYKELEIKNALDKDFVFGHQDLPWTIKHDLLSAVESYYDCVQYQFNNENYNKLLIINVQNTLESVLLKDRKDRQELFGVKLGRKNEYGEKVDYRNEKTNNREILRDLFSRKVINVTELKRLYSLLNIDYTRPNSLRQYLYCLLLSADYEPRATMFEIFKGEVDPVLDIADLRNSRGGHGHATIADIKEVSKEQAETSYQTMKRIINEYISKY